MSSPDSTAKVCALCETLGRLRQSHIVPKFVFDWVKRQGGGRIRGGTEPNIPLQDGPKLPMLCSSCEARFSAWEREAANRVFRVVHSSPSSRFEYGEWFLPFAVSVSFRVLKYYRGWVEAEPDRAPQIVAHVDSALSEWAAYLLGKRKLLGPYEHHCIVLPSEAPASPEGHTLRHFFEGVVDFQPAVAAPDGSTVVITKMCKLWIVGIVKRGKNSQWTNTRIAAKGGVFTSPFAMPTWFVDYLGSRFAAAKSQALRLTERQRTLLWEEARQNGWLPSGGGRPN